MRAGVTCEEQHRWGRERIVEEEDGAGVVGGGLPGSYITTMLGTNILYPLHPVTDLCVFIGVAEVLELLLFLLCPNRNCNELLTAQREKREVLKAEHPVFHSRKQEQCYYLLVVVIIIPGIVFQKAIVSNNMNNKEGHRDGYS